MSSTVALHRATVHCESGRVYLGQEADGTDPVSPEEGVIATAAPLLTLASYRNQSLHVFVRPAMLATAMHITRSTQRGGCRTQEVSPLIYSDNRD